jgi:hypothetical protein
MAGGQLTLMQRRRLGRNLGPYRPSCPARPHHDVMQGPAMNARKSVSFASKLSEPADDPQKINGRAGWAEIRLMLEN